MDGALIAGDAGSFVNSIRLKGIHLAMHTGMLAAETAFEAVRANDVSVTKLAAYQQRIDASEVKRELYPVRNVHQSFEHGLLPGTHFAPHVEGEAHAAAPAAPAAASGAATTTIPPSAAGPAGTVKADPGPETPSGHGKRPSNVQIFFGIYFLMTGLHGIHVLAGMGAIAWLLVRSIKGHFGPYYFMPVDFVGLYWHLVDLIWIFLFPLLYLVS